MIPTHWKIGAGILLTILLVWGGVALVNRHQVKVGTEAEHRARESKGEANAHQNAASQSDSRLPEVEAKLAQATAGMAGARAEVARLRKALATRPEAVLDPNGATEAVTEPVAADPRDALIASQDVLIGKQDVVISEQAGQIVILTTSRDEWKATAEARERQAMAQEAATRAWKSAVTTGRWNGRLEGFAAGAILGYIGGKR